jgi:long chain fatty acid CoA FadD26
MLLDQSLSAVLHERATQQPDARAFTYIDYELDTSGYAETLTWSQVRLRAQVVAAELVSCGSPGDRVAICAPQGLEYLIGFFGALEAGFIAVPLSVPMFGAHDERVSTTLRDCRPVAIVTTSAVVGDVVSCAHALAGRPPAVIEIDALDLDTPVDFTTDRPQTKTALLQYTSGSTRAPTGVVVTHKNVIANLHQVIADYFEDIGGVAAGSNAVVVAAVLSRHGAAVGAHRAGGFGAARGVDEPDGVSAEAGAVDADVGGQ